MISRHLRIAIPPLAGVAGLTVITPNLRAEAPLLFRATAGHPASAAVRGRQAFAAQSIDWGLMIDQALRENAATVLWDAIAPLPDLDIPAELRARIQRLALVWTLKLRLLEARLHESVAVLAGAGIDVVLLKGAALAVSAYPSFIHRPMADLDILVDADRVADAHQLMQATGWVVEPSAHPSGAWDEHHHLPPLADDRGSGLRIEIHAAPLAPGHAFRMDATSLRATATSVRVGRTMVRVPEPHVHVVHAAIHFAWSHCFESGALNAFRDIAVLSATVDFSWDRVIAVARETGSETSVYWTLRLGRRLSGLAIPAGVLEELAPPHGERTLSILEHHFVHIICRTGDACPSVAFRRRLWAAALRAPITGRPEFRPGATGPAWRTGGAALIAARRLAAHLRRLPRWSCYCAGLLRAAVEVSA